MNGYTNQQTNYVLFANQLECGISAHFFYSGCLNNRLDNFTNSHLSTFNQTNCNISNFAVVGMKTSECHYRYVDMFLIILADVAVFAQFQFQ